jgi:hypothetical protein
MNEVRCRMTAKIYFTELMFCFSKLWETLQIVKTLHPEKLVEKYPHTKKLCQKTGRSDTF